MKEKNMKIENVKAEAETLNAVRQEAERIRAERPANVVREADPDTVPAMEAAAVWGAAMRTETPIWKEARSWVEARKREETRVWEEARRTERQGRRKGRPATVASAAGPGKEAGGSRQLRPLRLAKGAADKLARSREGRPIVRMSGSRTAGAGIPQSRMQDAGRNRSSPPAFGRPRQVVLQRGSVAIRGKPE